MQLYLFFQLYFIITVLHSSLFFSIAMMCCPLFLLGCTPPTLVGQKCKKWWLGDIESYTVVWCTEIILQKKCFLFCYLKQHRTTVLSSSFFRHIIFIFTAKNMMKDLILFSLSGSPIVPTTITHINATQN